MYILLSSEETLYKVKTSSLSRPGVATVVTAELHHKIRSNLPELIANEQKEYITTAAEAAYSSLNPLDWTQGFHAEIRLIPNNDESVSFDPESNSSGLGYALALALQFRRQLNKGDNIDHEVFATGWVHASGSVSKIGHLPTKITAACNHVESQQSDGNKTKPFFIFYPKANHDEVTKELVDRVQKLGGKLIPVTRLSQALSILLGDSYDGVDGDWSPFKGLESFNYQDQKRFFGRERALQQLLQNYQDSEGLLVVTGVSGSGKSSVIKAGLIPEIEKQLPEDQKLNWHVVNPKAHNSVESILIELFESLKESWQFSEIPEDLAKQALKQAESINVTHNLQTSCLWFIDQYEEIFNNSQIPRELSQYLAPTLEKLANKIEGLRIVVSIRAEYLETFGRHGIDTHVSQKLNPDEWNDVVKKQAAYSGLKYEKDLDQRIINDANDIAHALPVVEYLLEQLYQKATQENESAKLLKQSHYEELGGLKGVVANRAEAAISHDPHLAETFFDYFVGQNSEGIAYPRSVEIKSIQEEQPELYQLIQLFIDEQLVIDCSSGHKAKVKLAHDSLFTEWGRLKEWLENQQDYLVWRNRIDGQFTEWENSKSEGKGKSKDHLIKNKELLRFGKLGLAQGSIRHRNLSLYVNLSIKAKRKLLTAISFTLVLVVVLAVLGIYLLQKINKEEMESAVKAENDKLLISESNRLLGLAKKENDSGNYDTAMLLALNAMPGKYGGDRPDINSIFSYLSEAALKNIKLAEYKHKEAVNFATMSPNQELILTASDDDSAIIWSAKKGKKVYVFGHEYDVISGVFSPNGELVITGSRDNTAKVWSLKTGELLHTFYHEKMVSPHWGGIYDISFSNDGKLLATASSDNTAILWSMENFKKLFVYPSKFSISGKYLMNSVKFNQDGTEVLTGSSDGLATLWSTQDGKKIKTFSHQCGVSLAAFSPDEQSILTATCENAVLWSVKSGEKIQTFDPGGSLDYAEFNNDASLIVTGAKNEKYSTLWSVEDGRKLYVFEHDFDVNYSSFSSDGQTILSCTDNSAITWSVKNKKILDTFNHQGAVVYCRFNPDNDTLLTASGDNTAALWRINSKEKIPILNYLENPGDALSNIKPNRFILSPDENDIIIQFGSKAILWSLIQREKLFEFNHEDQILDIEFSHDGKYVLTASKDYTCILWSRENGNKLHVFNHKKGVLRAEFSPDDNYVLAYSQDGFYKLWSTTDGKLIMIFDHNKGDEFKSWNRFANSVYIASFINSPRLQAYLADKIDKLPYSFENRKGDVKVKFSRNKKFVLTEAPLFYRPNLWSVINSKLIYRFKDKYYTANPSSEFGDKEPVKASIDNRDLILWSTQTGQRIKDLNQDGTLWKARFSQDENYVLTISANSVILWSTKTGEKINVFEHNGNVKAAKFININNGKYILTSSSSDTATLWSISNNKPLQIFQNAEGITDAIYITSLHSILTTSYSAGGFLWEVIPSDIINYAISKLPLNRTCLTPEERIKYDLPALTNEQIVERGCLH